jgi:transposase
MDTHFGVDMAKDNFVSFGELAGFQTCKNQKAAIAGYLKGLPPGAVIAVESTGGYHLMLAEMATRKGFSVYVVQPGKVKSYRQSSPHRGKSDNIDAKVILGYIQAHQKELHPFLVMAPFESKLRKLSRTRDALVRKHASLVQQLRSLGDSPAVIKSTLSQLARRIEKLTVEVDAMIASAEDAQVLLKISCVKNRAVSAVLPALRTIPFKDKYGLDAYFGMDLKVNESGKSKGRRRMSKEGDKYARHVLYMCAMTAVRSKAWKDVYDDYRNVKKLTKVQALNALARKILHTIYGVYKSQTEFVPRQHKPQMKQAA